ncbi:hypothetical protein PUMCH_002529 [Australozyma saopauloensis]|uniref:Upf1 domain-containing protein n=1 Tax=Australozyma saopauloensis TaxID=291208 RepID=A0AAX4H9J2_9ASCO|nr:hypothetical protein PUMCH_002529 [[Candida] saopauloensis]
MSLDQELALEHSVHADHYVEIPSDSLAPAHTESCAYCGLESSQSVVKCGNCHKWFCNGKGKLGTSHIVIHMIQSKHNSVMLQESSPLGAETLECYNCEVKNVFTLGFVAAKQDLMVVLLCRMPCAHQRDINWATDDWQPLVDDRALLPWVAPFPSPEESANARDVLIDEVRQVEALWKLNKDVSLEEVVKNSEPRKLLPVLLRSQDGAIYHNSYIPLIEAETAAEKASTESQVWDLSSIEWSENSAGAHIAEFVLSPYESKNVHIYEGEEVKLHFRDIRSHDGETWTGQGTLILIPRPHKDRYTFRLKGGESPPQTSSGAGYSIEFLWLGVSHFRMMRAVRSFATNKTSTSAFIYHTILGHEVEPVEFSTPLPKSLSFPALTGLRPLNASQEAAVSAAIRKPFVLIQGPPGTGKSVTASAIVYHLSKMRQGKILVCAPLNVAVDHITGKLEDLGLSVVRVYSKKLEGFEGSTENSSLHSQAKKLLLRKMKNLLSKQEEGSTLATKDAAELKWKIAEIERKLIKQAQIVCCTCAGAMDVRLQKEVFRCVLIDESTQACEPEIMIPITKGAKQVILIGDHQQLGPVILDKGARKAGLSQSLFERMIALGQIPYRLEVQYRMHPALSEFPSNMFYEGALQNGVISFDREWPGSTFPWPVPSFPMMFWANYGKEEVSSLGLSYLNRVEAMNVEKIISRLFRDGVEPSQIGVITPYEGQRAYLTNFLQLNSLMSDKRSLYEEVEISSVDAFQGREKDFIILSCVRANDDGNIGFLRDTRRLNVAITRARYGLMILGNPRSLSRNKLWRSLLIHYRERGCLVEGPLENLQLSVVPLKEDSEHMSGPNFDNDLYIPDDVQSMVSYVPEFEHSMPQEPMAETYDDRLWPKLTSNQASRLDGDAVATHNVNHDRLGEDLHQPLKEFANVFSSALNI